MTILFRNRSFKCRFVFTSGYDRRLLFVPTHWPRAIKFSFQSQTSFSLCVYGRMRARANVIHLSNLTSAAASPRSRQKKSGSCVLTACWRKWITKTKYRREHMTQKSRTWRGTDVRYTSCACHLACLTRCSKCRRPGQLPSQRRPPASSAYLRIVNNGTLSSSNRKCISSLSARPKRKLARSMFYLST